MRGVFLLDVQLEEVVHEIFFEGLITSGYKYCCSDSKTAPPYRWDDRWAHYKPVVKYSQEWVGAQVVDKR